MHWAIHLIIYAILFSLILGAGTFLVISLMQYYKIIGTESSKCPVYSCGSDKTTTATSCQGRSDAEPNQPYYAYRTNTTGTIECQSSRALDQVQLPNTP